MPESTEPPALTRNDVAHVAVLARLSLSEEELDAFTGQLARVIEHARDIGALDVSGVEPTSHPLALENVVRVDEIRPGLSREAALAGAPAVEDGRFRVPRVLGEGSPANMEGPPAQGEGS